MSEGQRIGAMIVDGHSILRVVLQVMDQSEEFEVVGQAADGEEAIGWPQMCHSCEGEGQYVCGGGGLYPY